MTVGDRQRSAAAVTGGAGVGAGAVGADDELDAIEAADRAAAGSDGFDRQHGRDNADAGFFGFEFQFKAAVEARNVGTGAAHVEADGLLKSRRFCRAKNRQRRQRGRRGGSPCQ